MVGMFPRSCDVQGRGKWLYLGTDSGGGIFGGVFYFYDGHVFIIILNMELCVSVKISFICNPVY
jgi:hypothetical protein